MNYNFIIYKTTNLINNKIYVGQHCYSADDYLGSGLYLKKAIKKYGKENFKREILEHCTSANINEREIFWIKELNVINQQIGYNITEGGEGTSGNIISEQKKKFYQTKKGLNVRQESSKRMSEINKKYDWSGKNNPNYQNGVEKYIGEGNPFYNKKHSNETKLKLSKIKSQFIYKLINLKTKEEFIFNTCLDFILFCQKYDIGKINSIKQIIWRSNKLPHIFKKIWLLNRINK